jgi:hypothetical protein
VFTAIGGVPTTWEELAQTIAGHDREKQDRTWRLHQDRMKLAELSMKYVHLHEVFDRPPTLKEFGFALFESAAMPLDAKLDDPWLKTRDEKGSREERVAALANAWELYSQAIQTCLATQ